MNANNIRTLIAGSTLGSRFYLAAYRLLLPRRYRDYLRRARQEAVAWGLEGLSAKDMCHETLLHGTFYEEYLLYRFDRLSAAQRREYLTDAVRNAICLKINDSSYQQMLLDKYRCYQYFRSYYHREAIRVASETDRQRYEDLASRCKELVMKPLQNCAGRGVSLLSDRDFDSLPWKQGPLIVEERIPQADAMSKWHPSSVNTVRMNTILKNGRYTLMNCFLRTGCGGNFVDNGAQGGLFALIDPQSGRILTDGHDERGRIFPEHPDTCVPYRGTPIPEWSSLCALAEKAARAIPQLVYVGWDFALTPAGWVMVEANKGQFVCQQTLMHRGLRREFEELCF